ncbi:MAG: flagellar assembly protein FliW [Nitrospinae bacterium]|nr:flagellar assembly protein FliW [Nitrospinota bacterium]
MKIKSARMGDVEINPASIITFTDGIIGFPDQKRYVELDFLGDSSPLRLLQAVDSPELGFIIIDPYIFVPGYSVNLSEYDVASLSAAGPDELEIKAIVTIPEDPYDMTANLQGPIIINKKSMLARQVVNNESGYGTKHKILTNPMSAPVAGV